MDQTNAAFEQTSVPLSSSGIILDAESIRAELEEAPTAHDLTIDQAELIEQLDDEQINQAINQEIDDEFWAQYDDVRRRAISNLVDQLGIQRK